MQQLQSRFSSQDDAESAMRKLASLRSDRFRLERVGSDVGVTPTSNSDDMLDTEAIGGLTSSLFAGSAFQTSSGIMAFTDAAAYQGVSPEDSRTSEFTLSANVPGEALEQARTVILQSGGQIV